MSKPKMLKAADTIAFYGHSQNAEYNYMSNFYLSPITIPNTFKIDELDEFDNLEFASSEQLFMFMKCITFLESNREKNIITLLKILKETTPSKVKELGRQVSGFNETEWDKHKYNCMMFAVTHKFQQNKNIKTQLLQTGNKYLIEASPYDKIWGIGLSVNNPDVLDKSKWKGLNLLGDVLMDVRNNLKS
jgi:ribA/ribD-fused uncharacterized protein